MAGYNRYSLTAKRAKPPADFLEVLQRLDRRWAPPSATLCSRQLARPAVIETRPAYVSHLDEILPYGQGSGVEADFTHEYLTGSCEQRLFTPPAVNRRTLRTSTSLGAVNSVSSHLLL